MSTDFTTQSIGQDTATTPTTPTTDAAGDPVARYQYLLRTASPDQIEQAHEQAFAQMSEPQRREVLQALARTSEAPADTSAESLARSATRLEVQQPGALQQALGAAGGGTGRTVLTSLAAGFLGAAGWSTITGGDGVGGRPGLLSRLFNGGGLLGGLLGRRRSLGNDGQYGGGYGYGNNNGYGFASSDGYGRGAGMGGPGVPGGHPRGGHGGHRGGPGGGPGGGHRGGPGGGRGR